MFDDFAALTNGDTAWSYGWNTMIELKIVQVWWEKLLQAAKIPKVSGKVLYTVRSNVDAFTGTTQINQNYIKLVLAFLR